MLKWMPVICISAAMTLAFVIVADAQEQMFLGPWQQVETNAGACRTCRIEFAKNADFLNVTANNGWSASVSVTGSMNHIEARGNGVWSTRKRGWVAGRPFDVLFRLIGQRLHMRMRVKKANGSRRLIEAVFERKWLGA